MQVLTTALSPPPISPQVQRGLEEQAEAAAARKDLHPSAQKVVTKE
jgi:hypothetical protein